MAPIGGITHNINGYIWHDVTNQTVGGRTYDKRDVIACGGKVPWIVSIYSEDKPAPIKEASAAVKKPQNKFWVRNPNDKRKNWKV